MHEIQSISLDNPVKWNKALKDIKHSFAHTWEYNYAMHLTTGFHTYLVKFEKKDTKIVCPISERKYMTYTDIITPLNVSGFVGKGFFEEFPSIWREFAQKKGYICGYFYINPYFAYYNYFNQDDIFLHNYQYGLDLTLSENELFKNLSSNRKRQIKNFEKILENICLEKTALIDFFIFNYDNFFKRKNASSNYYNLLPKTIKFLLNQDNVFLVGFIDGDSITAVSAFAYTLNMGDYLFNVSIPGAEKHSVPLIWYGLKILKSMNIPYMDLGGSRKINDSLAEFKRRFGSEVNQIMVLKQIYDFDIYKELCSKIGANPNDKSGYFPPYHAL